jgi:hypothetical protein
MRKVTLILAMAACAASMRAQDSKPVRWRGPEVQSVTPAQPVPETLQKIFSNLGPADKAYSTGGFEILGPLSSAGGSQFISLPFTPTANAHVYQVRAAIQYLSAGTPNEVNISLYGDNAGVPGTLLAGPVTVENLSSSGCCQLAIATFRSGLAVVAGTQYWIVADTPASGTGSDFEGVWDDVPPTTKFVAEDSNGGGWYSFAANLNDPAAAVYGTVP